MAKSGILKYSEKALSIFENAEDSIETSYPLIADFYAGLGNEFENNYLDALIHYQKVMEDADKKFHESHPLRKEALGRWMLMRIRLHDDQLESARKLGMCECWPFDNLKTTTVKPIKRIPMRAPDEAIRAGRIFGYSVIEFDLDDDGSVLETRILVSWPEEYNNKDALKSVKKWTYSPRKASETDKERSNLFATIHYIMLPDETKDGVQEINIVVN